MSQYQIFDVSGGVQTATTWLLRASNEVYDAENVRFDKELGSAERRLGYTLFKQFSTKPPLAFFEAKFATGIKIFYAYNNAGDTNTVLSCYDPVTDTSVDVKTDYPPNCKLQMIMNGGELYVAGITTDTGARQQIVNIQSNLTVSNYRNLFTSPKAAFIGENSGALYAMNVEVNGVVHPERAYVSSPQRGAITYVNAAMTNTYAPVDLVNQVPAMTSNTTPSGVAAASNVASAPFDAWKAFDRNLSTTEWSTSGTGGAGTLSYDFGSGVTPVIKYYSIGQQDANTTVAPKDWTFEGSNNGSTWTVISTRVAEPAFATGDNRTYITSNTTAYRYYRLNITASQGNTNVAVGEFALFSQVQPTSEMQVKVDSARYVKVGMTIDIYKAGTNTKLYTVTPTSVDKSKDTFNFLPYNLNVSAVNATTDKITVSSATLFPTGTPVLLQSTGTLPAGLTAGTTYYTINDGSNDLKLAGSLSDSRSGASIDLTSTGSGTITLYISYKMDKTDELWLSGRQDDSTPSLLWNIDYRSEQTADFIFIAAGKVADTAITGWAKSNNRLNIFTKTSTWQYDNANFLPVFEDIGCISHDTIQNNGTFIIWLDASGKVRARDSASGQDQIISRPMKNNILDVLAAANLQNATAIMFDSNYKLDLGQIGTKYVRIVYNFDMNVWWKEGHKRRHTYALNSSISGTRKSYFLDDGGRMFLDGASNLDWTDTIPWFVQYGRRNFGTTQEKNLNGLYIHGKNISSSSVMVKAPGIDVSWQTLGELKDPITEITIPDTKPMKARDYDFKVSGNSKGDSARVEGLEAWFHAIQSNF